MADAMTALGAASGCEAAAILLMVLSEDEASEVLSRLDPEEVQQLGTAMFGVADVSETQVEGVLDQFVDRARARTTLGFGADVQIRGIMQRALGQDRAENLMARITPVQHASALEALKWMDAPTIARLIESEHPQIAALVLAHLEPPIAADVLQLLDEEMQPDLVYRVATLGPVAAEALEELELILLRGVGQSANVATTRRGGAAEAAQIVNNTRKIAEARIIKGLAKLDKSLARQIEEEMFVFENLNDLDDKSLGALMRGVSSDILVVALKGAPPPLRLRMLGCMSARAAQSIQDEMNEKGPIRLAEVQDAQKEILSVARDLADAGTIMLGGRGDDYV
jgi:flagellar motor switch protein FliG